MAYITREDGERFVIPSYRDVLTVRQKSQLKKDILLLSQSYGEYITLQKKSAAHYEVAFSSDTGYLLGESVWHYFKKPIDLIYCEAIPNTTEALLVIVKSGSVYLDGSFPLDSIPEELIIFLSQQNNFEIYTYGDVPISQTPEAGKFSFEASSVRSFTVLDKPVFSTLPLLRVYQLQLVDTVLKEQGIGVFPTRKLVMTIIILGLIWMMWDYFTRAPVEKVEVVEVNPYQAYYNLLSSPAPEQEIAQVIKVVNLMDTMPGWTVTKLTYAGGSINASILSSGGTMEDLFVWAKINAMGVQIKKEGVFLNASVTVTKRAQPNKIYEAKQVVGTFIDKIASVYPGNHFKISDFTKKGIITSVLITVTLEEVALAILQLVGNQFKDLPFVLQDMTLEKQSDGTYNCTIRLEALGS